MFSNSTIEKVQELNLVQVIQRFDEIQLKKSGASYKAKSPFTDEKTPSFTVSPAKNIWKCFSTGKGGNNPISFVMEYKRLGFVEAVHLLSEMFQVEIEYDREKGDKYMAIAKETLDIQEVNQKALNFFWANLFTDEERTTLRKFTDQEQEQFSRLDLDQVIKFNIGFAPAGRTSLKDYLLNKGVSIELMVKAGLISAKETTLGFQYTDFFRNRIMFPIYSLSGKLLGFSGRSAVPIDKKYKVFNSIDSASFKKSKVLLGIDHARYEITKANEVIKVEGNFDVTSFHSRGLNNTVATLGSALTEDQVIELRKLCNRIILAVDNDKGGLDKIQRDLELLFKHGFTVRLWYSDKAEEDPFDYVERTKKKNQDSWIKNFESSCVDALEYIAQELFEGTEDKAIEKSNAQNELIRILAMIQDGVLRNNYVKLFNKAYQIDKKSVEERVQTEEAEKKAKLKQRTLETGFNLPHYLPEDEISEFPIHKFYADYSITKCGYHFAIDGGGFKHATNCIIRPLFKVEHVTDSIRVAEIIQYQGDQERKRLVEIPNKAFHSQSELEAMLTNADGYFHGSKQNFQALTRRLMAQFTVSYQIKTLGWQREGFFAFANGIIDNGFKAINKYGICVHGDKNYFLPAFSAIYSNMPFEDDPYENDRAFIYKDSGVSVKEWSTLFNKVYSDRKNGMFGIAMIMATLFSDHIFKMNNSAFPLLFGFGLPGTGKSTMGRSMSRVFKTQTNEFNLNQGTPIALSRRLSRGRNVLEHLDEYQNDLPEPRFQTLKGMFDRTGHEKGVLSRDSRTEVTKVNATGYISGQYMPSRDGNSLSSRSVLLTFEKGKEKYSNEEIGWFNQLTKMEDEGLSSVIVELIRFRDLVESQYGNTQFEIQNRFKEDLKDDTSDGRVVQNFTVLCSIVKLLGSAVGLPFSFEEFYKTSLEMIIAQSAILQDSNQLSEFFKTLQFLILERKIEEGQDYKIEELTSLSVRKGSKGTETISFPGTKAIKVIHINFARTYPLYQQMRRIQNGENGLPETTLKTYMKSHRAFIGTPGSIRFDKITSSAYSFKLDDIGVSLELLKPEPFSPLPPTPNTPGIVNEGFKHQTISEDELPF